MRCRMMLLETMQLRLKHPSFDMLTHKRAQRHTYTARSHHCTKEDRGKMIHARILTQIRAKAESERMQDKR